MLKLVDLYNVKPVSIIRSLDELKNAHRPHELVYKKLVPIRRRERDLICEDEIDKKWQLTKDHWLIQDYEEENSYLIKTKHKDKVLEELDLHLYTSDTSEVTATNALSWKEVYSKRAKRVEVTVVAGEDVTLKDIKSKIETDVERFLHKKRYAVIDDISIYIDNDDDDMPSSAYRVESIEVSPAAPYDEPEFISVSKRSKDFPTRRI